MTRPRQIGRSSGFTLLEVMIVILIIAVVAGLLLPLLGRKDNRQHINCVSNLKQIGTGFRMYASDNGGRYPPFNGNKAWQYFQAAGDQLSSPKILQCPNDKERPKAPRSPIDFNIPPSTNSFAADIHQDSALSYFYGVDVFPQRPDLFLAGDRNLALNKSPLSGLAKLKSGATVSWTTAIHREKGNIGLVDGSVQQTTTETLRKALAAGTNETQRLMFP